ncbi:hypothetical protein ACWC0A_30415 [Streptomyces scopuliridis]
MAQQKRVQKPARAASSKRAERDQRDGERGRQEVRKDVRKTWWPEG